jgi:alpha-L-fucosidase
MKLVLGVLTAALAFGQSTHDADPGSLNKAERLEWFRDQGFGMFIHWSVDSQLGVVISHSLAGASDDYNSRFFNELPKTFNPRKFHPEDWAALAKLAGVKYVMFTAKHHSGFCMWDSATTPFNIINTPFHRDTTGAILDAFRAQGIAPGVYFSPDDFWWLWKNGKTIQRGIPDVQPAQNPGLMAYDQAQVRELLTKYGNVDLIFFDGEAQGLRDLAWKINPNIVVTRGAIQTPEQYVPGIPLEGAWEANLTMGTAWQYQPRNEVYKSGGQVLDLLIETRAKGGNLLMNVGPKPDGELPIEQEERLREVALWMFVNQEAIYAVRPWAITNEQDIWFTKKKDADTLYAIVKEKEVWKRGAWKDIVLHSVKATDKTEVSVLGQNDLVYEYQPKTIPKTTFRQEADGLHIRAFRSQRLQDNSNWPNPAVLKITNVKAAFQPPQVVTEPYNQATSTLSGQLRAMGDAASLEVGFEYRDITGLDTHERYGQWITAGQQKLTAPGRFTAKTAALEAGHTYEFRALVKHPLLTMYGAELQVTAVHR